MSVLFADGIYRLKFGIKTLGEQFEGVNVENLYIFMRQVLRICKGNEVVIVNNCLL